ncbi:arginase [Curvibacter sp. PAE-UM]|uniref:arginase n=1 Tax=Curvibacter sp. PAE-UM TaxID=1714344 RepID=UPI00070FE0F0|nr:arginase [Curvibacter sp. PAE-UM]KRH99364.1 arginase [Curvibacter sp. PAE-UM]
MPTALKHEIELIGAPADAGAGVPGARLGPGALRGAGLAAALRALGWSMHDAGNLDGPTPSVQTVADGYRNLAQVTAWNRTVHDAVTRALDRGRLPLLLGGDHSLAIGSISAVARHCRASGQPLRVLWFDAHADCNSRRTSPSANLHGMPVACLCGVGPMELCGLGGRVPALVSSELRLIGVRSVDPGEAQLVQRLGLQVSGMDTLRTEGADAVMAHALKDLPANAHLHVSLDLDFLDPEVAPGTGTTVAGGASLEQARQCLQLIARCGRLGSLDVMELNPALDRDQRTTRHALDLIAALLGAGPARRASGDLGRT